MVAVATANRKANDVVLSKTGYQVAVLGMCSLLSAAFHLTAPCNVWTWFDLSAGLVLTLAENTLNHTLCRPFVGQGYAQDEQVYTAGV